jgi:hypothetical protein
MIARRARLQVEELDQRVLPSTSSLGQGIIAQFRTLPFLADAQITLEYPSPILAGGLVTPQQSPRLVIRNAKELLADTGLTTPQLAARLHVSTIDWNYWMVVLASDGVTAFGAWTPHVDITALDVYDGKLTVDWHFVQPNPHQVFPLFIALGDPAEVVLTTRFTGPVSFHEDPTVTLPPPPDAVLPILAHAQIILDQFIRIGPQPPVMQQQLVIRGPDELFAATGLSTAELAARLNVSDIDWNKQMVVLVSDGVSHYGFPFTPDVDITALDVYHGKLTVDWHFVWPYPQGLPQTIEYGDPAEVVLTTKFTGPVTFHPDPTVYLPPLYPL